MVGVLLLLLLLPLCPHTTCCSAVMVVLQPKEESLLLHAETVRRADVYPAPSAPSSTHSSVTCCGRSQTFPLTLSGSSQSHWLNHASQVTHMSVPHRKLNKPPAHLSRVCRQLTHTHTHVGGTHLNSHTLSHTSQSHISVTHTPLRVQAAHTHSPSHTLRVTPLVYPTELRVRV